MAFTALPFAAVTAAAKSDTAQSDIIIGDDDYSYKLYGYWDWDEETEEEFYVTYAKITGTSKDISGDITIPATLGGYPVEEISGDAFSDRVNVTSVVVPESVRRIEDGYRDYNYYDEETEDYGREYGAFSRCTSLKSVTFLGNETGIGSRAFYNCTALETVVLPEKLNSISWYMFYSCKALKNISLPSSLNYIDDYAFKNCESLESVILPEGMESISDSAFENCSSLKSIVIPEAINHIGSCAFENCTALSDISVLSKEITYIGYNAFYNTAYYNNSSNWENNVLYIGQYLISSKYDISGNLEIKDGTTLIANEAFYNREELTGITCPDSLLYINYEAFEYCYNLSSVTFGNNLKYIGDDAFKYCAIISVTVPGSVKEIGYDAFRDCDALSSLTLENGIVEIYSQAFWGCSSLESVSIPESVTNLSSSSFADCESLKNITVGTGNKQYCSENGILFENDVNYEWGEDDNETIVISEKTGLLCYPMGKTETAYNIPESVRSIDSYAFYGNGSLKSISVPEKVEYIGSDVFSGCSSLESINLPENIEDINSDTFYGCSSLSEINIPENVTWIGDSAFSGCSLLSEINIPENVTYIGSYAFSGCSLLKSINLPEGLEKIDDNTFPGCSSLSEINIPENVTYIGSYAFYGCSSLESVEIPYGVTEIEFEAFSGCTSLSSVKLPATLITIGYEAFYNCPSLKSITIQNAVEEIESEAFGCYEDERWGVMPVPGFTVYGFTGSKAEAYANDYGFDFISIDGTHAHLFGEWETTKEATVVTNGEEKRTCPRCGFTQTRKTDKIPANEVVNEETGISIIYPEYTYDYGEVSVSATEKTSGDALDALNAEKNGKKTLFDISMYIDGEKLGADEMEGNPVWVKVPLPEGYDASRTNVYYVNDEGKLEKMKSFVEGGYVYFEATHFSDYAIVEETVNQTENCDHICHKKGIAKFFYKIARIFWKLFKKNKVCKCGALHY